MAANIAWSTSSTGAVASQSVKCQRQRAAAVGGRQPNPRNRRRWQSSGIRQRVQPTEVQCAGEQNPRRRCSCQPSPHRKVGEGHRDPRRGESPSARFDCSVEASSGARSRAADMSSIGFLSGFRRACQEAPHCCRGGSYQSTPHETYPRIRARARVGKVGAVARRGSDPPATIPSTAAEEVNLLRATVAELRREQVSLMAQLAQQTETDRAIEMSGRMETFIDDADADLRASQRFTPY